MSANKLAISQLPYKLQMAILNKIVYIGRDGISLKQARELAWKGYTVIIK